MNESYSERSVESGVRRASGSVVMESAPQLAIARELLAQLFPGEDADRIVRALLVEREAQATDSQDAEARYDSEREIGMRNLARVRGQFALGAAARALQHAFNNPLTALLAEAQLLELETLSEEQQLAVTRILNLTRRLAALSRRLGTPGSTAQAR